ncbi:MAG TPA: nitrogenase cofactor biosynthesis protein NifB [Rhodocyclaceae bacterium]|uniref:nitrogenase cofactor biosynthesis protein NifB n=2 Tax=Zoogloea sp. TaxID=49181 RepID=UPI002B9FE7E3|nr:nitrogenase cofactor biosynthesis protein NifB [Zoogloea sp.]HMV18953.1 nitrogenase cofactor biosynthesis protein NifB [Rhodocyclaceae bacterium]HMV65125.1 nitrogenase cofactor biosynthesis protein NifB [Rhodocyclaceae bacterium]HMY51032.1 nitrogenase cofactor biosynthesis protein NifB [Rhodocyclaceae bacterium]HNB66133.1 nitrogenase cofactor biosynthesis protein NifB [Rhodocyclaceae bacterium]HNC81025.1 nitrogenase cofactor biosynthesis protein NifB [Rhodocyclaceae bacterium]
MDLPVISSNSDAEHSGGGCSSSGCGTAPDALSHLPDHIRAKVQDHPCYSEEAHHYFARMHVAVAPACNIQCNYCNRKYDCSNESRPGVVSELLSPDQAIKKVLAVAAEIPQMTVLGIAGPGDPLANPDRTFETFRQLSDRAPDIKLCVSTNGLNLPQYVDEIAKHNIDHVTITINCIDPEVGAQIYPWIYWNNKRIRGVEGARILIEQQQKGLEMLTSRGILVKVNSVMIPGVNDHHLKEVSKVVKAKGAFLHNVMPLIAEAEHGTYYGIMEQRGPTPEELQELQDACAGDMAMMRHCRQCRADAVGLLGEDRGAEFTLDKIDVMDVDYEAAMARRKEVHDAIIDQLEAKRGKKAPAADSDIPADARPVLMAVAGKNGVVAEHFGHAREFLIYEASPAGVRFISHRKTELYCGGADTCGEGDEDPESLLARNIKVLEGCEVVLCSKIGYEPWGMLEAAGIAPNGEHAMEPIEDAVMAVYKELAIAGRLSRPAPSKMVA